MFIQTEETPNPNALKFLPGREVLESETLFISGRDMAYKSPLAAELFRIEYVKSVFLGQDFITITKTDDARWEILKPMLLTSIMEYIMAGKPLVANQNPNAASENDEPIVKQIKELIETRVRPAVAMDGGDIVFRGFEDGVVLLELHGSCSGCPSSSATLKSGIENMLKHYVPEVVAVEAVV